MSAVTLYAGDCLDALAQLPDASVDAVITDPPYGLADHRPDAIVTALTAWANGDREHVPNGKGFMGRDWDAFVPPPAVWDECLRLLKPGGHLVAFAGSRTYDLMGLSIRMAGFEIRDGLQWLYGSGFPKSLDVSKAIDKAAGAEREAIGPARNRLIGGAGGASTNHGRGGVQYGVDAVTAPATDAARQWQGWGTALKPAHEPIVLARKPLGGTVAATVLQHGTGAINIDACRVEGPPSGLKPYVRATVSGTYSGTSGGVDKRLDAGAAVTFTDHPAGRWPSNVLLDEHAAAELDEQSGTLKSGNVKPGTTDSGGASRFFPTFRYQAKAPTSERPKVDGVAHPTVKPLALMHWLVRLIVPPGGVLIDPFAGSGTTLQAAREEGFDVIGVERSDEYLPLIRHRLGDELEVRTADPVLAGVERATSGDELDELWDRYHARWRDEYTEAVLGRFAELGIVRSKAS